MCYPAGACTQPLDPSWSQAGAHSGAAARGLGREGALLAPAAKHSLIRQRAWLSGMWVSLNTALSLKG